MEYMKKVAIYCRVSTEIQILDRQVEECSAFVTSRGMGEFVIYTDTYTGSKKTRPGLQAMLKEVHLGNISTVCVLKLDRLGRSLSHLLEIITTLNECNVKFVSIGDAIDTTTSAGRMLLGIMGSFAEYERAITIERIYSGIASARKRNVKFGRPAITPMVQDRIQKLVQSGMSYRKIAKELEISLGSVSKAMKAS